MPNMLAFGSPPRTPAGSSRHIKDGERPPSPVRNDIPLADLRALDNRTRDPVRIYEPRNEATLRPAPVLNPDVTQDTQLSPGEPVTPTQCVNRDPNDPIVPETDPSPARTKYEGALDLNSPWNGDIFEEFRKRPYFRNHLPKEFPLPKAGDHWHACHELVERHDNSLCEGWNDDINTLLVYAGLFSAAVTAFTIESSQRLERDPVETAIEVLLHISRQLAEENVTAASLPDDFVPSPSDRRINVLWFLSLIVSLMTALLGILCKQWLREYQKDAAMSSKQSVALRQLRFDAFNYWRVEDLISSLPLLLQITVLLFILGVLDFLWQRDPVTARVITIAAVLAIGAVLTTTLLPAIVFLINEARSLPSIYSIPDCAYKSPQAHLCLRVALLIKQLPRSDGQSWLNLEKQSLGQFGDYYIFRAVSWLDENYSTNWTVQLHLAQCLSELDDTNHPDLQGVKNWKTHILASDEVIDMTRLSKIRTFIGTPWPTLTARILFQFLKNKIPQALATDSGKMAELKRYFSELTLILVGGAPQFLSEQLESDETLTMECAAAIGDIFCDWPAEGVRQMRIGERRVVEHEIISKGLLRAAVGPAIRFMLAMLHYQNSGYLKLNNRRDCYLRLSSSLLTWLEEECDPYDLYYVRYHLLDSIDGDRALTSEQIATTVQEWASRAQRLELPTFRDFFTILEFLDRSSSEGSRGREVEWASLVREVRSRLESMSADGYFPYSDELA